MSKGIVLSLYDYTGEGVKPWAEAGYQCHCFDIKHPKDGRVEGNISFIQADLHSIATMYEILKMYVHEDLVFAMAYPVCTDLAVSGAKHFEAKAELDPDFQNKAANYAINTAVLFEILSVPYFIENPVSRLATLWRKPDYYFHPYEYGHYLRYDEALHPVWPDYFPPFDAYSKKTCLWTSDDFIMPPKYPVDCKDFGSSDLHTKLGGKSERTKEIRSATPRGFAKAVFLANCPKEY